MGPRLKNINTLIKDVYHVVGSKEGWFDKSLAEGYSRELGLSLVESLAPRSEVPRLRLSAMGERCPRSLWASIHTPSLQEPYPPYVRIKFTYGHLIESLAIAMAKAAGHEVTGEQDEVSVDGVTGHRDCVIDGCIVDVKSANSRSFEKFKDRTIGQDIFGRGYLDQLDGYAVGSLGDDLVRVKDVAYLWAINKELGHMTLYEHRIRPDSIRQRINEYKSIIARKEAPPCTCKTMSHGESGNIKLDKKASYDSFKYACFPSVRKFLYAGGPVYLTKVIRLPDVPEVDRNGTIVYN